MLDRLSRRRFLTASALGAAGAATTARRAFADHWPTGNSPPGHQPGETGGADEGDVPIPNELPDLPRAPVRTEHDRGDALITRYQGNLEANDFGCWGDTRSGLIYVSQRATDRIAVFDRTTQEFVAVLALPTDGSGAHTVKVDEGTNSVWIALGEASKIGRLVLHPETRQPHNFAEYAVPGDMRPERKPHGIAVHDGEVWYTDDRQDRVGVLDAASGHVHVIDQAIEADGIAIERRHGKNFRVWVAGGSTVTVIDGRRREVLHEVPVPEEPGFSQLRLHDLVHDPELARVWVLSRGSDHVVWLPADDPEAGPQEFINPAETAAGLDHVGLGERYLWWTEGLANNVTRYDRRRGETRGYEVPAPAGYFNPHGIWVAREWREVWFTERESLCRLSFKDGRAP